MKANVRTAQARTKPFHDCPLRLTIGIIVKNGAQTLEKCLESVKPLLDAVPSELIVTDTGSTDATVEIAERYADRLIRFPWCGDFSAARNTGLDAARGEWFLFLDADEWFEDVSELIAFFRSGECDRYGSGCYIQRNYADPAGRRYSDFHAVRMFRRYPGIRFEHTIHEAVHWMKPVRFFSAYVNHFGYAFRSPEERREKMSRNLSMLEKALAEKPDDMKLLYQLSRQCFTLRQYDRIIACCQRGLELESGDPQREWRLSFSAVLVKAYYDAGRYREAIEAAERCAASGGGVEFPHLDCCLFETFSHYLLGEYPEAVASGERYFRFFRMYRGGKLDGEYLLYGNDVGIQPLQHENVAVVTVRSLAALGKYREALQRFARIDVSAADVTGQKISALCFFLAGKTQDFRCVAEYYGKILAADDLAKKSDFILACEACRKQKPEYREEIAAALAGCGHRDNYTTMNRMRVAGADRGAIQKLLGMLMPDAVEWDANYADVVYLALKSGADVSPLFSAVDADLLPGLLSRAEEDHPDCAGVFLRYLEGCPAAGRKGLFWRVCLEERVLLACRSFSSRELLAFFRNYIGDVNEYGEAIYRKELFTEEEAALLPRRFRFGRHVRRAFELEGADAAGCARELRSALRDFPAMREPIGLLTARLEGRAKEDGERAEEFTRLARQVKNQIETLIACGRLAEAGRATAGLAALVPEDDDIRRYRRMTHTELSLRETALQIPQ